MKHVLRIANQFDAFFCPVNKLHLWVYNPVGEATVVSDEIKKALKFGKIIDVNGTILNDEETEFAEVTVDPEKATQEFTGKDLSDEITIGPLTDEQKEVLLEGGVLQVSTLDGLDKDELLSFIKENGMTLKGLGLTAKSSADKIRDAIEKHLEEAAK